ncbi:MAG: ATP-binding protein [Deltaproteobacteria bacterium]|nr:ATP-binding protein [Deltaproteobacteria bacterium]
MLPRLISTSIKSTRKSVLLLGPRQVGKSTLIQSLKPDITLNLANLDTFLRVTSNPSELQDRLEASSARSVFIDEVQKYPPLLNSIQALLDEKKELKFFLTGSSARKLKRGRANLLPGRVINFHLGPLIAGELDYRADEEALLRFGGLPEIYLEKTEIVRKQILRSYFANYIQEEIKAEALVRNIDAFSRAIPFVISNAGKFVDYSKLAKQSKISRHALSRFYEIFEDTLIGNRLWPDDRLLEKADLIKHPKFFVFDNGIYNALVGSFDASEDRKGILFEQLLYNQLLHSAWARDQEIKIASFRTRGGLEADFIVTLEGSRYCIEVKGARNLTTSDTDSIKKVATYEKGLTPMVAYLGKDSRKLNGVACHPWQKLLKELGL